MIHWWLDTMPPISGPLRLAVYGGLLVLCLVDSPSPLGAAKLMAGTDPVFYTPTGPVRWLRLGWVGPRTLTVVRNVTVVFWVLAAAGLLQPVTGIVAAVGFAFLHSVNAGALGANHSTHSALYALICLSFSVSYGFSLDGLLAAHTGWPLLVPRDSVLTSGFAPMLLLVCLAYTMFAGAVSKLRNGGVAWLNGRALRFYLVESRPAARWTWLSRRVAELPWLCRLMALGAVLVEGTAPLAIGWSPARMPLVLAWACLHVAILLLMMPAYWIQMWCYLALLDWPWIVHAVGGPRQAVHRVSGAGAGGVVCVVAGLAVCAALLAALSRSSEEWPFTAVPMYSNGVPAGEIPLPEPDGLQQRARMARRGRHNAWPRAWVFEETMEDIWLGEPGEEGSERLVLAMSKADPPRFVRWSQYAKVVRALAIRDAVAGGPADDPERPGARFLHRVAPLVRANLPQWERFGALYLACRTTQGWTVIARAGLAADETEPAGAART